MLRRLWLTVDRRFLVAALGAAMAILLPMASTLVLSGLDARVDAKQGWITYADGPEGAVTADAAAGVRAAVAFDEVDGTLFAAYVAGDPRVAPDQAASASGQNVTYAGQSRAGLTRGTLELLPDDAVLVHPSLLGGPAQVVWTDRPLDGSVPARGADGYEQAGIADLQGSMGALIVVSMPATILVAAAFADQEVRERLRTAATFSALGRPDVGLKIVLARVALLTFAASALAVAIAAGLWMFGGATFHPRNLPVLPLMAAAAFPALAALAAGGAVAWWRLRDGDRLLQSGDTGDLPAHRLAWLPLPARPLALGTRLAPVIMLAAVLFVVDLGFPLAAAQVPAAIAGEDGEWVQGADSDIVLGGATDAAPGAVLWLHPDVDASVAEVMVPTLVDGHALLLRGGDFTALAAYHGITLVAGDASGLVVGHKAAARHDLAVGDEVPVQFSDRAGVTWMTITGRYEGGGLLADEAVLPMDDARALAGVEPGDATVVRVRPDTPAALAALESNTARIEVTRLQVPEGTAGSVQDLRIHVANVGADRGQRDLVVRVDGEAVASVTADLRAWSTRAYVVPIILPEGPFTVEVNPTQPGEGTAADRQILADDVQYDNAPIVAYVHREGQGIAGVDVGLFADLAATRGGEPLRQATTGSDGIAYLPTIAPGDYAIATLDGRHATTTRVASAAYADVPHIIVERAWIVGAQRNGEAVEVRAQVLNEGGAPGEADIAFTIEGDPIQTFPVTLEAGASMQISAPFLFRPGTLTVGDHSMEVRAQEPAPRPGGEQPSRDVSDAKQLQAEVADRVLGDARQALVGLATVAMASSLSIVYLTTDRTLRGRRYVLGVLDALGQDEAAVRRRVAWEAAILGAIGFLGAFFLGKGLFRFLGFIGWPAPFGHSLPDPFGWVFALQAMAAFGAASAMAGFLAAGPIVRKAAK